MEKQESETTPAVPPARPSPLRRLAFWTLLALSVGGSLWWIGTFPFHVDRLYSAIPPHVTVIAEHQNLGARWPELKRNPLVRNMVALAGAAHGLTLEEALDDPATAWWIERLAGRHAVLAYAPFFDETPYDAWIMASWVGRFSLQMRWSMLRGRLPGEPLDLGRGERGWMIPDENDENGYALSFALVDGALLACWSRHPQGVQMLMERKKWGARPVKALRDKMARQETDPCSRFDTAPDRGWLRNTTPQSLRTRERPLRIALTEYDARSLAGWIGLDSADSASGSVGMDDSEPLSAAVSPEALRTPAAFLGDSPAMLAVLPFGLANRFGLQRLGSPSARTLGDLLADAAGADASCFLAVLRPEFDGRILGLRTPGLVLGLRLEQPETGRRLVANLLDILNAALNMGVIPKNATGPGDQELILTESVNTDALLRLTAAEQPTFAVVDSWLLFALNRSLMERLIAAMQTRGSDAVAPHWRHALDEESPSGFLWMDFAAANATAVHGKAVYGLASHVATVPGDAAIRKALEALTLFTDAARPLKQGALRMETVADDSAEFSFRIGMVLGTGVEPAQP